MNLFNHPLTGTPFGSALDLCIVLAAAAWLMSVITREVSWVDRAWPICPAIYCLMVAYADGFDSSRVNLMTALVILWSARLTFNFIRKGGFQKGGEDYRWDAVREQMGPYGFQLLNIVFIAPAQMLLIWLFTSPVHQAWVWREAPLNWLDAAAAGLFLVFPGLRNGGRRTDVAVSAGQETAHGARVRRSLSRSSRPACSATAGTRTTSANWVCGGPSTSLRPLLQASGCTGRAWGSFC